MWPDQGSEHSRLPLQAPGQRALEAAAWLAPGGRNCRSHRLWLVLAHQSHPQAWQLTASREIRMYLPYKLSRSVEHGTREAHFQEGALTQPEGRPFYRQHQRCWGCRGLGFYVPEEKTATRQPPRPEFSLSSPAELTQTPCSRWESCKHRCSWNLPVIPTTAGQTPGRPLCPQLRTRA